MGNQLVKPKKHLGQHFLKDLSIAQKVALLFESDVQDDKVLEIGPGMGVLTKFLLEIYMDVSAVEVDSESVQFLKDSLVKDGLKLIEGDVLRMRLEDLSEGHQLFVVGNFPYNISSQIVFKVLESVESVKGFGGMFQKEVAERLVAGKGSKTYGILSVLLNAYYDCKYEFTIDPHVFNPPPKVKSGVIRCVRKEGFVLPCDKKLFFEVVKAGFNQRRKTLRNALHKFNLEDTHEFAKLRAEQLGVDEFISLTQYIQNSR